MYGLTGPLATGTHRVEISDKVNATAYSRSVSDVQTAAIALGG